MLILSTKLLSKLIFLNLIEINLWKYEVKIHVFFVLS